jgi:hypothetical protein
VLLPCHSALLFFFIRKKDNVSVFFFERRICLLLRKPINLR